MSEVSRSYEWLPCAVYFPAPLRFYQLLSSLHSLRYLRAADCEIGDEGAVFIADALSQNTALKTLDLRWVGT